MNYSYSDIVIAGGGLSGSLLAARLASNVDQASLAIVDKDRTLGGRLRSTNPGLHQWSYGLHQVNQALWQFMQQSLQPWLESLSESSSELEAYASQRVAILSAQKMIDLDKKELFAAKGLKALGGGTALKHWTDIQTIKDKLASGEVADHPFAQLWHQPRKDPTAVVLEQLVSMIGITNLWDTSGEEVLAKMDEFADGKHFYDWEVLFETLASALLKKPQNSVLLDAQIVHARWDEAEFQWQLTTRKGELRCRKLVVAQSPWEALAWLPKTHWHPKLLQLAVKAQPTSAVIMSELLSSEHASFLKESPQTIFIPAEDVHVLVCPFGDLIYQTAIDYEVSLQAPDVVKAVKRLKRARKKLQHFDARYTGGGEHLALMPTAFAQPRDFSDRRILKSLEYRHLNADHLVFIGDTYGKNACGDANIIDSILAAEATLKKPPKVVSSAVVAPAENVHEAME